MLSLSETLYWKRPVSSKLGVSASGERHRVVGSFGGASIVQIDNVPPTTPHRRRAPPKGVFVLRLTSPASKSELSLIFFFFFFAAELHRL